MLFIVHVFGMYLKADEPDKTIKAENTASTSKTTGKEKTKKKTKKKKKNKKDKQNKSTVAVTAPKGYYFGYVLDMYLTCTYVFDMFFADRVAAPQGCYFLYVFRMRLP